jgi:hypothetical protein
MITFYKNLRFGLLSTIDQIFSNVKKKIWNSDKRLKSIVKFIKLKFKARY